MTVEILWLALAFVIGLGAGRLGLPPLVGYLVAGILLSSGGFEPSGLLGELAHAGVLLLLFTVGLEVRFRNLLSVEVLGVGLVHVALIAGLVAVTLRWAGWTWAVAAFVGSILAFSSTVLAVRVLEDRRELRAFPGRVAIGLLVLQDVLAVGAMALTGTGQVHPWALSLLALPLLVPILSRALGAGAGAELLLLCGVVLALGGAELFELAGLGGELGAVVLGAIVSRHPRSSELAGLLWGLREVLLVAFFVEIGLLGPPSLDVLLMGLFLLALVPLKVGSLVVLLLAANLRARSALLAGLALASHSEFALIAARVGVDAGVLEPGFLPALGVAVAVSFIVAAPLNRATPALVERIEPLLERFETSRSHPDEPPVTLGSARALVVGMGRTGTAAYERLRSAGVQAVGIDSDPATIEACLARGQRVLYGEAEDAGLWSRLDLGGLDYLLLAVPDREDKLRAVSLARKRGFAGAAVATSHHREEEAALRDAGVSITFNPLSDAGARMADLALEGETRVASHFTSG